MPWISVYSCCKGAAMFRQIINAAAIGKIFSSNVSNMLQFENIVARLVKIIVYSVLAAFLIATILECAAFILYAVLLGYGFDPHLAVYLIAGPVLLLAAVFLLIVVRQIRIWSHSPTPTANQDSARNWPDIAKIAKAFADGFARGE
jgi:hypothetical protein